MASIRSRIGENMEDRYLFKANFDDSDRWVKGQLVEVNDTYLIIPNHASKILADCFSASNVVEVKKDTICQCTGLKDKNGNLIWENDIVGYYDKYVWKWCYGLVGYGEFNCSCCSGVYGWHFGDEDIREYQGYEVKGNKFDNPELLESEE